MHTFTHHAVQFTFDEFADVNARRFGQHRESGMHVGVQFGPHVFAFKAHASPLNKNAPGHGPGAKPIKAAEEGVRHAKCQAHGNRKPITEVMDMDGAAARKPGCSFAFSCRLRFCGTEAALFTLFAVGPRSVQRSLNAVHLVFGQLFGPLRNGRRADPTQRSRRLDGSPKKQKSSCFVHA